MKRPKRPAESKFGRDFQTGSLPTDSKGIDLSYSYRALVGVNSTVKIVFMIAQKDSEIML